MTRRQFLALLVPLLLVITGFIALWALERGGVPGAPPWDAEFAQYVRDRIGQEYVGGTGDERHRWQAYFNALDAYAKTFDDYAEVTSPWAAESKRVDSSGQYPGIGVRIEQPLDKPGPVESVLITGVKPLGPAAVAGVAVGDRIIAVDGRPVPDILPDGRAARQLEDSALQRAIKGPEGTTVTLRLRAPDSRERDVQVLRAQVDQGSVFGARILAGDRKIGYARVSRFQAGTARDLRAELEKLAKDGIDALVLDLRGNLGGLLDQAVGVANLFLDKGLIAKQRGRMPQFDQLYRADPKKAWNAAIPLAVIVNGSSASASEVLAGALRDHRRAVLVGERTYGKFLVQAVEDFKTDAGLALFKRTTSIYETPLGLSYQRAGKNDPLAGIPPDLLVPISDDDYARLLQVFVEESYADWDPGRARSETQFKDPQIEAARALLAGDAVYPALAS